MIELAPKHKRGLGLKKPILPATGIMGYSDAYRRLIPMETLGAFITNPITARPRRGAIPPRVISIPGGMLVHTGLCNPGVREVIRCHQKRWRRSSVPIIAHVVGVNVEEAVICIDQLAQVESVVGIELGLPDSLTFEEAAELITTVRQISSIPLIIKLPLWRATDWIVRIIDLDGADAVTVAAPPRGTVWCRGRSITGRLYGPVTLPQSLWVLRRVAELTNGVIPLIACGGVHSASDAQAVLEAGAVAVQVDSYIWKDPVGFARMADIVTQAQETARI